jgi:tripartite-type tricarboxylate transporter receptor subunit TctC
MRRLIIATGLTVLAGTALAASTAAVQAQTYPSRAITIMVPFPPGGSTDVVARIMAERMRPVLGQPVVIENVGGAGGTIGVTRYARATPDGYTIGIGQWDNHVGSVVFRVSYDVQKDLEPIGLMSINPQLMVGKKALPADDLKGLVAWMKANPGKATIVNQTAAAQVGGIVFQKLTGTEAQFIPYRGAGPAMQDLVSGQVDLMILQAAAAMPQVRAGTIKALANLSPQRSGAIPDIPTADEAGVPGLYSSGWFGFFAPKGTPKEITAKINGAMVEALADPAVRNRFTELGLDVASREQQTPDGLAKFQQAEIEKWWPIIKDAGIKAE